MIKKKKKKKKKIVVSNLIRKLLGFPRPNKIIVWVSDKLRISAQACDDHMKHPPHINTFSLLSLKASV